MIFLEGGFLWNAISGRQPVILQERLWKGKSGTVLQPGTRFLQIWEDGTMDSSVLSWGLQNTGAFYFHAPALTHEALCFNTLTFFKLIFQPQKKRNCTTKTGKWKLKRPQVVSQTFSAGEGVSSIHPVNQRRFLLFFLRFLETEPFHFISFFYDYCSHKSEGGRRPVNVIFLHLHSDYRQATSAGKWRERKWNDPKKGIQPATIRKLIEKQAW